MSELELQILIQEHVMRDAIAYAARCARRVKAAEEELRAAETRVRGGLARLDELRTLFLARAA